MLISGLWFRRARAAECTGYVRKGVDYSEGDIVVSFRVRAHILG